MKSEEICFRALWGHSHLAIQYQIIITTEKAKHFIMDVAGKLFGYFDAYLNQLTVNLALAAGY